MLLWGLLPHTAFQAAEGPPGSNKDAAGHSKCPGLLGQAHPALSLG